MLPHLDEMAWQLDHLYLRSENTRDNVPGMISLKDPPPVLQPETDVENRWVTATIKLEEIHQHKYLVLCHMDKRTLWCLDLCTSDGKILRYHNTFTFLSIDSTGHRDDIVGLVIHIWCPARDMIPELFWTTWIAIDKYNEVLDKLIKP